MTKEEKQQKREERIERANIYSLCISSRCCIKTATGREHKVEIAIRI